jgi:DNA replication ATP-dependent helicase/nuclease Dna2
LPPISQNDLEITIPKECEEYMEELHLSEEIGLSQSIFERLVHQYENSNHFIMLSNQYRMNSIISDFISEQFYHGKLKPGEINEKNVGKQNLFDLFHESKLGNFNHSLNDEYGRYFNSDTPMVFIDTYNLQFYDSKQDQDTIELDSIFNTGEAKIISKLIIFILSECFSAELEIEDIKEFLEKIGIISGYRAHNQTIIQKLRKTIKNYLKESNIQGKNEKLIEILNSITVDTVDRFQGQEREIIMFSFVDSNPKNKIQTLNSEIRRLNVAISRAKKKVIFVGNSRTLTGTNQKDDEKGMKTKKFMQDLIKYIKKHNGYFEL